MRFQRGVTLIELVVVLIVLAITSVGITSFVSSSISSVVSINDRDQVLNGARFPLKRLQRELANAIPNSIRVLKNNGEHCLQFVPFEWVSVYLDLPVAQDDDYAAPMPIIAPQMLSGSVFEIEPDSHVAIVYPLRSDDIYLFNSGSIANERLNVRNIMGCGASGTQSCTAFTNNTLELVLENGFLNGSPAERVYFARNAVNFCVTNNALVRFESEITASQPTTAGSGGVVLANNISNTLLSGAANVFSEDDPFQYFSSSRIRNAVVQVRLRFLLNGEFVAFQQEVHIANAP